MNVNIFYISLALYIYFFPWSFKKTLVKGPKIYNSKVRTGRPRGDNEIKTEQDGLGTSAFTDIISLINEVL